MKKKINKIIGFFSLGLLFFAVNIPIALATSEINYKDAWTFMEDKASDKGQKFKSDFGNKEDWKSDNVLCGKKKCNLSSNVCLEKKENDNFASYICARRKDKDRYISKGYTVIAEKDPKSLLEKIYDYTKTCYQAKAGNDSQQAKWYCVRVIGDNVKVKAGQTRISTCEVVEVAWYNNRNCRFCSMMGVIYATADKITITAQKAFARSFAIVIVVGIMVWLAFRILIFVSDLSKQDAAALITELITNSFKFLVAFFLLLYYEQIFDMLILPLLRAGMNFGTLFVEVESIKDRFGDEGLKAIIQASSNRDSSILMGLSNIPLDYVRNADNKFFDLYTYVTMENLAYNVNMQYSLLQTIGESLICTGFNMIIGLFSNVSDGFGLGFACLIYGICFGVFGFLLSIAFIFYLLDAVVQLGIVGALLPFLIACWPFKITSKYSKTGFDMLLNSIFIFIMMGVVANLSIELIKATVEFNANGKIDSGQNGLAELVIALSEIDTVKLNEMVNIFSIGFILFIISNLMAMQFLKQVESFAGKFASGGISSIASEFAGTSVAGGYAAAKRATGAAKSSMSKGFSKGFKNNTKKLREDISGVRRKIQSFVGNKMENARVGIRKGVRAGVKKFVPFGDKMLKFNDKVKDAKKERLEDEKQKHIPNTQDNKKNKEEILS